MSFDKESDNTSGRDDRDDWGLSERERLVEILLPEALGGEGPPDLAARVVKQAQHQNWLRKWKRVGLAAVLFFGLGLVGWLAVEQSGREPHTPVPPVVALKPNTTSVPTTTQATVATTGGVILLHGDGKGPGSVWGTEDSEGVITLPGSIRVQLIAWTTVKWEKEGTADRFELLEGGIKCFLDAPGEVLISSVHGEARIKEKGSVVTAKHYGVFADRDPMTTLISVKEGVATIEGWWGEEELVKRDKYLFDSGPVEYLDGRRILYPGAGRLPAGEITYEGAMAWGPSGWTIRAPNGKAYVVMREPTEMVTEDLRPPNRFKVGWIYRVTWENGTLKRIEEIRKPAVKYRRVP